MLELIVISLKELQIQIISSYKFYFEFIANQIHDKSKSVVYFFGKLMNTKTIYNETKMKIKND